MNQERDSQEERRSKEERRKAPWLKSVYRWNFDPLGNWWKEKRSGKERRKESSHDNDARSKGTETG